MGDNHIITHWFRQLPETVNLLKDNELKRFVGKDDYRFQFVTPCLAEADIA
jgi:hypothetical protein